MSEAAEISKCPVLHRMTFRCDFDDGRKQFLDVQATDYCDGEGNPCVLLRTDGWAISTDEMRQLADHIDREMLGKAGDVEVAAKKVPEPVGLYHDGKIDPPVAAANMWDEFIRLQSAGLSDNARALVSSCRVVTSSPYFIRLSTSWRRAAVTDEVACEIAKASAAFFPPPYKIALVFDDDHRHEFVIQ